MTPAILRFAFTPAQAEVVRRALMTAPMALEASLPVLQAFVAQVAAQTGGAPNVSAPLEVPARNHG